MKKSLIALAVLASAGVASAQSSVTLFGIVDTQIQHLRASDAGSLTRLNHSGYNSSRLGFRGTEDLGGGLSASFWLEAGIATDTGAGFPTTINNTSVGQAALTGSGNSLSSNTTSSAGGQQGLTMNRRSTLSLSGGFGEVRLGRDYVPTFWNLTVFDPFGTSGVGAYTNVAFGTLNPIGNQVSPPGSPRPQVRSSNSIGYFLPGNLGGFYGQGMFAFSEQASSCTGFATNNVAGSTVNCTGADKDGRYMGLRVGYANGPVNVAVSADRTRYSDGALVNTSSNLTGTTAAQAGRNQFRGDTRVWNIGGQWDFGVAKAMAQYGRAKLQGNNDQAVARDQTLKSYLIGALVPVGPGEIRVAYSRGKIDNRAVAIANENSRDANQIAVGYVHNLSKRTAVYATYARIRASGTGAVASMGLNSSSAVNGGRVTATGYDFGVRHSF